MAPTPRFPSNPQREHGGSAELLSSQLLLEVERRLKASASNGSGTSNPHAVPGQRLHSSQQHMQGQPVGYAQPGVNNSYGGSSSARAGGPDVLTEVLERVDTLTRQLLERDADLARNTTQLVFLERDLVESQAECAAARQELQREATRSGILEQRVAKSADEVDLLRSELHSVSGDKGDLDRTLTLVQVCADACMYSRHSLECPS